MYCTKCGYGNDNQALFCARCGTALQSIGDTKSTDQYQIATGTYAGFWLRLVAAIIDNIVVGIIGMILAFIIGFWIGSSVETERELTELEDVFTFIGFIISVMVGWFYWALMEMSTKQATLGKMAVGIVVTDLEGRRISFLRATGRYFAKYISWLLLFIGFIMILFTEKKQGLHDILAGCFVVKK